MSASPRECRIGGCPSLVGPKGARGLCTRHYQMWLKTGDPLGSTARTTEERFWQKVQKGPDCWEWTASKDGGGYGMFKDGRTHRAHRWLYERTVGPVPDGEVLDHLCRNTGCVKPAHLEPVTNDENLERGWGRRIKNGMANVCASGHTYTPSNTYTNPLGRKVCRVCAADSRSRYESRKAV